MFPKHGLLSGMIVTGLVALSLVFFVPTVIGGLLLVAVMDVLFAAYWWEHRGWTVRYRAWNTAS